MAAALEHGRPRQTGDDPVRSDGRWQSGRRHDHVVEAIGRFRVYLGAAPGVGKTVAMLNEGLRRKQRGRDVAVGIRRVPWAGRDRGAGSRPGGRPAAGSWSTGDRPFRGDGPRRGTRRHPRWPWWTSWPTPTCPARAATRSAGRTSSRLLTPTSTSITTVNIQHLESIADAVERIIEVPVRERVPTGCCARPTRSSWSTRHRSSSVAAWCTATSTPPEKVPQALLALLPDRQPDRAARAGPPLPGRRDRRAAPGVSPHPADRRHLGDQRAHPGRDHHRTRHRRHRASGVPHGVAHQGRPPGPPRSRPERRRRLPE